MSAMIVMILLVSSTIIVVSYFTSKSSVENVFSHYIQSISNEAVKKTVNYFDPAENALLETASFLKLMIQGEVSPSESLTVQNKITKTLLYFNKEQIANHTTGIELNTLLERKIRELYAVSMIMKTIVMNHKEVRSLSFGTRHGDFFMMMRMPDGTLSEKYIIRHKNRSTEFVVTAWIHENQNYYTSDIKNPISGKRADYKNQILSADDEKVYDPRKRSWYKDSYKELITAKSENRTPSIHWTEPRVFF